MREQSSIKTSFGIVSFLIGGRGGRLDSQRGHARRVCGEDTTNIPRTCKVCIRFGLDLTSETFPRGQWLQGIRNLDRGHVMASQATPMPPRLWTRRMWILGMGIGKILVTKKILARKLVASRGMSIVCGRTSNRRRKVIRPPCPGREQERRKQHECRNFARESHRLINRLNLKTN
jgi:hypothetical protein